MEIIEVTPQEYSLVVSSPYHIFNSAQFNSLNAPKCDQLFFWLFREGKFRLGLIAGLRNDTLLSPFSAPYGGFSFLNDEVKLSHIEGAIDSLIETCRNKQIKNIILTLPPLFYNESFISKTINSLYRKNFFISNIDLDYAFNLDRFHDKYIEDIWHNARKNLKTSLARGLEFIKCCDTREMQHAYEIIKYNRQMRGFPLRMTWDQVAETIKLIKADFFIVTSGGKSIASAIIFHVSDSIVQVIYWGDMPEHNEDRTMNYLSYKVFEYYKKTNIKYVDIGPSTEDSQPNYGLCEFKESIGCFIITKSTLKYENRNS